jgi:hypothetical protein
VTNWYDPSLLASSLELTGALVGPGGHQPRVPALELRHELCAGLGDVTRLAAEKASARCRGRLPGLQHEWITPHLPHGAKRQRDRTGVSARDHQRFPGQAGTLLPRAAVPCRAGDQHWRW